MRQQCAKHGRRAPPEFFDSRRARDPGDGADGESSHLFCSECEHTPDQVEFMMAMDEFKRKTGRKFPTCSDVLRVIRELGYRKTLPEDSLPSPGLS